MIFLLCSGLLTLGNAGCAFVVPYNSSLLSLFFKSPVLANVSGSGIFTIKQPSMNSNLSGLSSAFSKRFVPGIRPRIWIRGRVECLMTERRERPTPMAIPRVRE